VSAMMSRDPGRISAHVQRAVAAGATASLSQRLSRLSALDEMAAEMQRALPGPPVPAASEVEELRGFLGASRDATTRTEGAIRAEGASHATPAVPAAEGASHATPAVPASHATPAVPAAATSQAQAEAQAGAQRETPDAAFNAAPATGIDQQQAADGVLYHRCAVRLTAAGRGLLARCRQLAIEAKRREGPLGHLVMSSLMVVPLVRGGSFVRERAPAKRRSRSPGGSRSKGVSIFRSSAAAEDVRAQSAEGSASLLDTVVRNLETVQTERRGAVLQAAQFGAGSSKRGAEVVRKTAWLVRGASASVKRLRDLATDAAQLCNWLALTAHGEDLMQKQIESNERELQALEKRRLKEQATAVRVTEAVNRGSQSVKVGEGAHAALERTLQRETVVVAALDVLYRDHAAYSHYEAMLRRLQAICEDERKSMRRGLIRRALLLERERLNDQVRLFFAASHMQAFARQLRAKKHVAKLEAARRAKIEQDRRRRVLLRARGAWHLFKGSVNLEIQRQMRAESARAIQARFRENQYNKVTIHAAKKALWKRDAEELAVELLANTINAQRDEEMRAQRVRERRAALLEVQLKQQADHAQRQSKKRRSVAKSRLPLATQTMAWTAAPEARATVEPAAAYIQSRERGRKSRASRESHERKSPGSRESHEQRQASRRGDALFSLLTSPAEPLTEVASPEGVVIGASLERPPYPHELGSAEWLEWEQPELTRTSTGQPAPQGTAQRRLSQESAQRRLSQDSVATLGSADGTPDASPSTTPLRSRPTSMTPSYFRRTSAASSSATPEKRRLIRQVTTDRLAKRDPKAKDGVPHAVRRTFECFDRNGNGTLEVRELREALQSHGLDVDSHQVAQLLSAYDAQSSGELEHRLDLREFAALVTDLELDLAATRIQRQARGVASKQTFHTKRLAAVKIQSLLRRKQATNYIWLRKSFKADDSEDDFSESDGECDNFLPPQQPSALQRPHSPHAPQQAASLSARPSILRRARPSTAESIRPSAKTEESHDRSYAKPLHRPLSATAASSLMRAKDQFGVSVEAEEPRRPRLKPPNPYQRGVPPSAIFTSHPMSDDGQTEAEAKLVAKNLEIAQQQARRQIRAACGPVTPCRPPTPWVQTPRAMHYLRTLEAQMLAELAFTRSLSPPLEKLEFKEIAAYAVAETAHERRGLSSKNEEIDSDSETPVMAAVLPPPAPPPPAAPTPPTAVELGSMLALEEQLPSRRLATAARWTLQADDERLALAIESFSQHSQQQPPPPPQQQPHPPAQQQRTPPPQQQHQQQQQQQVRAERPQSARAAPSRPSVGMSKRPQRPTSAQANPRRKPPLTDVQMWIAAQPESVPPVLSDPSAYARFDDTPFREVVSTRDAFPDQRNLNEVDATPTQRVAALWHDSSFLGSRAKLARAELASWRNHRQAWKRSAAFRREVLLQESWKRADRAAKTTEHVRREQQLIEQFEREDEAAVRVQRWWRRRQRRRRDVRAIDVMVKVQVAAAMASKHAEYTKKRKTPPRMRRGSAPRPRATRISKEEGGTGSRATSTADARAPTRSTRTGVRDRDELPHKRAVKFLMPASVAEPSARDMSSMSSQLNLDPPSAESQALADIHEAASQISNLLESLFSS